MNVMSVLKPVGRFFKKNLPTIFSSIACAGVVATGYLAYKEGPKAKKIFDENRENDPEGKITFANVIETGKAIAPVLGTAALTIGCIIASNGIHLNRYSALSAAYGALAGRFTEYKVESGKVLGDKGKVAVAAAIASNYIPKEGLPEPDKGKEWFFDEFTHMWFQSDFKTVLSAGLWVEQELQLTGLVYAKEFYEWLNVGLDLPLEYYSRIEDLEYCWDSNYIIESWDGINRAGFYCINFQGLFDNSQLKLPDGRPYYKIGFDSEPIPYDSSREYDFKVVNRQLDSHFDYVENKQVVKGMIFDAPSKIQDPEGLLASVAN